MTDKSRENFEAEFEPQGYDVRSAKGLDGSFSVYINSLTEGAWRGWQASESRILALLDSEEMVEILRNSLYVKHPAQTEDERIDNAIKAIKEAKPLKDYPLSLQGSNSLLAGFTSAVLKAANITVKE